MKKLLFLGLILLLISGCSITGNVIGSGTGLKECYVAYPGTQNAFPLALLPYCETELSCKVNLANFPIQFESVGCFDTNFNKVKSLDGNTILRCETKQDCLNTLGILDDPFLESTKLDQELLQAFHDKVICNQGICEATDGVMLLLELSNEN